MATKRIDELRRGDVVKVEGKTCTVKTPPLCFTRNQNTWAFDVQVEGSKSACVVKFPSGEVELTLVSESQHEPIPEELRDMTRWQNKPKRRRKK